MDILNTVTTLFGEYTLYIYAALAVLYFWKTKSGKRLYEELLDKLNDKKVEPQPVKPVQLSQSIQPAQLLEAEVPSTPKVTTVEPVEMPKVAEGIRAVGITLINQDLAKLSIENQSPQKQV